MLYKINVVLFQNLQSYLQTYLCEEKQHRSIRQFVVIDAIRRWLLNHENDKRMLQMLKKVSPTLKNSNKHLNDILNAAFIHFGRFCEINDVIDVLSDSITVVPFLRDVKSISIQSVFQIILKNMKNGEKISNQPKNIEIVQFLFDETFFCRFSSETNYQIVQILFEYFHTNAFHTFHAWRNIFRSLVANTFENETQFPQFCCQIREVLMKSEGFDEENFRTFLGCLKEIAPSPSFLAVSLEQYKPPKLLNILDFAWFADYDVDLGFVHFLFENLESKDTLPFLRRLVADWSQNEKLLNYIYLLLCKTYLEGNMDGETFDGWAGRVSVGKEFHSLFAALNCMFLQRNVKIASFFVKFDENTKLAFDYGSCLERLLRVVMKTVEVIPAGYYSSKPAFPADFPSPHNKLIARLSSLQREFVSQMGTEEKIQMMISAVALASVLLNGELDYAPTLEAPLHPTGWNLLAVDALEELLAKVPGPYPFHCTISPTNELRYFFPFVKFLKRFVFRNTKTKNFPEEFSPLWGFLGFAILVSGKFDNFDLFLQSRSYYWLLLKIVSSRPKLFLAYLAKAQPKSIHCFPIDMLHLYSSVASWPLFSTSLMVQSITHPTALRSWLTALLSFPKFHQNTFIWFVLKWKNNYINK